MPVQSATPAVLSSAAVAAAGQQVEEADCGRLLELFGLVPDPRRRHRVASVLALATAAVLAGCTSVLAVGEWVAEAPQQLLAALGARRSRLSGRYLAPHVAAFRRLLTSIDANAVDAVIGIYLAERAGVSRLATPEPEDPASVGSAGPQPAGHHDQHRDQHRDRHREQDEHPRREADGQTPIAGALAVDGKAVRGAKQADARAVHLLSAMVHGARAVVAPREVAHKTNEITQLKPLLDPLDLRGWAVTLDAMHCQRQTARYLVEDKQAAYVVTAAKNNQPGLLAALDALPWRDVPVSHTVRDHGHGQDETPPSRCCPRPRTSGHTPSRCS